MKILTKKNQFLVQFKGSIPNETPKPNIIHSNNIEVGNIPRETLIAYNVAPILIPPQEENPVDSLKGIIDIAIKTFNGDIKFDNYTRKNGFTCRTGKDKNGRIFEQMSGQIVTKTNGTYNFADVVKIIIKNPTEKSDNLFTTYNLVYDTHKNSKARTAGYLLNETLLRLEKQNKLDNDIDARKSVSNFYEMPIEEYIKNNNERLIELGKILKEITEKGVKHISIAHAFCIV